jgi:hypothetical protein
MNIFDAKSLVRVNPNVILKLLKNHNKKIVRICKNDTNSITRYVNISFEFWKKLHQMSTVFQNEVHKVKHEKLVSSTVYIPGFFQHKIEIIAVQETTYHISINVPNCVHHCRRSRRQRLYLSPDDFFGILEQYEKCAGSLSHSLENNCLMSQGFTVYCCVFESTCETDIKYFLTADECLSEGKKHNLKFHVLKRRLPSLQEVDLTFLLWRVLLEREIESNRDMSKNWIENVHELFLVACSAVKKIEIANMLDYIWKYYRGDRCTLSIETLPTAYEISEPLKTPMLEICFNLLKQLVEEYFIEKNGEETSI